VPAFEQNKFRVDPADIQQAVSNKTKLIILNTPANPTGAILDRETLKEIAAIAQHHRIFVLSDEPYEHIVFDGRQHTSIASIEGMQPLTISAFTLSKSYAMTGWRVGYAVAPKTIIDEMEKLMEHQVSGVTSIAQRAALAAITGPRECVAQMVEAYRRRRDIVAEGLNDIAGISCLKPEATFYAFANIADLGMSSWDFARFLATEHKAAVVPGSIFGDRGEGYVRVSFAADEAKLQEGIARIRAAVLACC
jgi:aspartate/methionine/tyrosine aminotransferase